MERRGGGGDGGGGVMEVIETEAVAIDGGEFWVKSYTVSTSNDSTTWTTAYSDRSVTRVIF